MKTQELRNAIKSMNLSGLVSLDFNRGYNNEDKNHHVVIGDQMLSFGTAKEQNKVYDLLVGKFGFEKWSSVHPFISEEEQGWAEGWAADMANPAMHGRVMYSILSADGDGGVFVWDYNLQKTVKRQDLTPAPVISENK